MFISKMCIFFSSLIYLYVYHTDLFITLSSPKLLDYKINGKSTHWALTVGIEIDV